MPGEEIRIPGPNERNAHVTGARLMPWKLLDTCWIVEVKIKPGRQWHPVMGSARAKRGEAEAIMDAIGTGDRTVVRDELGEVYLKTSCG